MAQVCIYPGALGTAQLFGCLVRDARDADSSAEPALLDAPPPEHEEGQEGATAPAGPAAKGGAAAKAMSRMMGGAKPPGVAG